MVNDESSKIVNVDEILNFKRYIDKILTMTFVTSVVFLSIPLTVMLLPFNTMLFIVPTMILLTIYLFLQRKKYYKKIMIIHISMIREMIMYTKYIGILMDITEEKEIKREVNNITIH